MFGDDLTEPVWTQRFGDPIDRPRYLPDEALPDCVGCEKPDLTPENQEVVYVYEQIRHQQMYNSFNGMWLGLREEALIARLDKLVEYGQIEHPEIVLRRIGLLDMIAVKHRNARAEAMQKERERQSRDSSNPR